MPRPPHTIPPQVWALTPHHWQQLGASSWGPTPLLWPMTAISRKETPLPGASSHPMTVRVRTQKSQWEQPRRAIPGPGLSVGSAEAFSAQPLLLPQPHPGLSPLKMLFTANMLPQILTQPTSQGTWTVTRSYLLCQPSGFVSAVSLLQRWSLEAWR